MKTPEDRVNNWKTKFNPLGRKFKTPEFEIRYCRNRMIGLKMLKTFPWRKWMASYDIPNPKEEKENGQD